MEEDNIRLPEATDDAQQPEEIMPVEDTVMPEEKVTMIEHPQTEDMEVHHHSHAAHGKKNWKSYFWEFLMLFLAVFCGFLAEYQLEHVIEHQREKKFAGQMLSDLRADSLFFAKRIKDIDSIGRKH